MSRVFLTGGNGFVAGSILLQAPADMDLHVFSRSPLSPPRPNIHVHAYQEVTPEDFAAYFEASPPDAVLHTAAIAAIDYCEAHREEAWRVNVEFPRTLAQLCSKHGARMIHCSTDNVFDGARGLYREDETPVPVNFYGHTKVEAEKAVREAVSNHVIARISIVYGLAMMGAGNSFLEQMLPRLRDGQTVGVPSNEIRSPIDVVTLGQALLELSRHAFVGNLHLANNDRVNRVELVRRIAVQLGLSPDLVVSNDPTDIPGRAPRPVDVSLSNALARQVLKTEFCSIEEGMRRVLALAPGTA